MQNIPTVIIVKYTDAGGRPQEVAANDTDVAGVLRALIAQGITRTELAVAPHRRPVDEPLFGEAARAVGRALSRR